MHAIFFLESFTFIGRNEKGQLGIKDCPRKDVPTPMENVQDFTFVGAAVGRNHTILLTGQLHTTT